MKNFFFLLVSFLLIAGCNKNSDKSYLDSAKKNMDSKKVTEAIADYNNLLKDYPESKLAPEALYQLGTIYQNVLDKSINEIQSLEKAVQTYKQVAEKYPESKQAQPSLFMAGFIEANDLKRFDQATIIYKSFLQKFPNSELAPAAKDELENMGMTPQQILDKKAISSK